MIALRVVEEVPVGAEQSRRQASLQGEAMIVDALLNEARREEGKLVKLEWRVC